MIEAAEWVLAAIGFGFLGGVAIAAFIAPIILTVRLFGRSGDE
ncbi:MAG: hypothetical protein ACRCYS_09295 [Beijerinckiaceae bacterium]